MAAAGSDVRPVSSVPLLAVQSRVDVTARKPVGQNTNRRGLAYQYYGDTFIAFGSVCCGDQKSMTEKLMSKAKSAVHRQGNAHHTH